MLDKESSPIFSRYRSGDMFRSLNNNNNDNNNNNNKDIRVGVMDTLVNFVRHDVGVADSVVDVAVVAAAVTNAF